MSAFVELLHTSIWSHFFCFLNHLRSFEWTFDGDLIVDGQAEFNVDLSGIDSHPDNNGSNFGYPPSVTQVLESATSKS